MRVLVACEFSGIVRDAFAAKGHDAWSCDLEPTERLGQHYQGDVRDLLGQHWDLMIAHPPCTHLAVSGARWWKGKDPQLQIDALHLVQLLLDAPIEKIALENPIGAISKSIRPPDQITQPWYFGHPETKATCLWLKGLPQLKATEFCVTGWKYSIHREPPGPNRQKNRSRTFTGIAKAMADQWG